MYIIYLFSFKLSVTQADRNVPMSRHARMMKCLPLSTSNTTILFNPATELQKPTKSELRQMRYEIKRDKLRWTLSDVQHGNVLYQSYISNSGGPVLQDKWGLPLFSKQHKHC